MKYFIILLFVLSVVSNAHAELSLTNYGHIEGVVVDAKSQQPLIGVNIIIDGSQRGAATDTKGGFLIKDVPVGRHQLTVSMMGYAPAIRSDVIVASERVTSLEFKLQETVMQTAQDVVVSAHYFDAAPEKPVSRTVITASEIESAPGSGEDIFRILQSMPGVASPGTRSANLIVRGGSPDENLTLLDNLEVRSPLHFSRNDASMGIISIVNPALIRNVEFITGGFPVEFSDRMSSVFEIGLKDGNHTQFNHDVDFNLGGFTALIDGPVSENSSMIFSFRRGVFDLITRMMDRDVSPRYWDMVNKLSWQPTQDHTVSFVCFYYLDDAERRETMEDHGNLARKYEYSRWKDYGYAAGINWRWLISRNGYLLTTLEHTDNGWDSSIGTNKEKNLNGDNSQARSIQIKSQLKYQISDMLEMTVGGFIKNLDSRYHQWQQPDTLATGFILPSFDYENDSVSSYNAGMYASTNLRLGTRLNINPGIRYDSIEQTNELYWSPRFSFSYYLTDKTSLNGAWGYFYQTPSSWQMSLDISNQSLKSCRAIHYIAGIEHRLTSDTKISLETYYKDLDNTFVGNDTTRVITNYGSGYARGIEFIVQKKMSNNLMGSLAYTYSIARRRPNDDAPLQRFEFDRRHHVTFTGGYHISDKWQVGIKYQYSTGSPYTPIIGSRQLYGEWFVVEGDKFSASYPDFHSVDIRIDRRFYFNSWTLNVYMDIWNATNRENVLSYYYDVISTGAYVRNANLDFQIMPLIGISAQF
ncbi:TonB-dependent receptor [candidate division KSB1 bacterium]|nr:TonB-dependent receptor [candidate division KSB1 bacterium]